MRQHRTYALALAVGLALVVLAVTSAPAQNVSIGISTPGVNFGLNIGAPPPLVVVPGLPVYQAPSVPDNYFVYQGYYYLYHGDAWYYSPHHNGPWMALMIHQVPGPILAVPVPYYKKPSPHWKKHGPPPWAPAKGYDRGPRRYEARKGPGRYEERRGPARYEERKGPGRHEERKGPGKNEEKKGGHR
jgi:hypothetical protein